MITRKNILGIGLVAIVVLGVYLFISADKPTQKNQPLLTQASVTLPGSPWTKRLTPVLAPSQSWEQNNVSEPNVWFANGKWHMIYTGGWEHSRLGYATSSDGIKWVKYEANPIVGGGAADWSGNASQSSIFLNQNRLYVYFTPTINHEALQGGNLLVASGADALHLHVLPEPAMRYTKTAPGIVNTCLVKTAKQFVMLFESDVPRSNHWETGYAVAASPNGPFVPKVFPISSLQHGTGMFGGVMVTKSQGTYTCWYHASQTGFLPTDIYSATSPDLTHWTQLPMQITRSLPFEVDQVADPFVVQNKDQQYLYYSAMDNSHGGGRVCVATRKTQL